MKLLCDKRCISGESPVWNDSEKKLYYVNGLEQEIIKADTETGEYEVIPTSGVVCALTFTDDNRMIFTRNDGVYVRNSDGTLTSLYDTKRFDIRHGSISKAGPDGCCYVGTKSGRYCGTSDKTDGRLYRIDSNGNVTVVIDGMLFCGGFDWSADGDMLYHTDSGSGIIREYEFDKKSGNVHFTGRQTEVSGVCGFAADTEDCLLTTGDDGRIFRINTADFTCVDEYEIPAKHSSDCCFAGADGDILAVVTSRRNKDLCEHPGAGLTYVMKTEVPGRKAYLFRAKHENN